MQLNFYKYQGTGNDFVVIDDRQKTFAIDNQHLVSHLCDRRFGIGADGLMLLRPAQTPATDFQMVYFNADGKQSTLCGNGGRCIVAFANFLGLFQNHTTFEAIDGLHQASITGNKVALKMNEVTGLQTFKQGYFLNTGSPHYVEVVENVKTYEVVGKGKAIRHDEFFRSINGTNANFMEVLAPNHIFVRTFERGVEDETYSCGTGVTAAAILYSFMTFGNFQTNSVQVQTLGGELAVTLNQTNGVYTNIVLTGTAKQVFHGTCQVD